LPNAFPSYNGPSSSPQVFLNTHSLTYSRWRRFDHQDPPTTGPRNVAQLGPTSLMRLRATCSARVELSGRLRRDQLLLHRQVTWVHAVASSSLALNNHSRHSHAGVGSGCCEKYAFCLASALEEFVSIPDSLDVRQAMNWHDQMLHQSLAVLLGISYKPVGRRADSSQRTARIFVSGYFARPNHLLSPPLAYEPPATCLPSTHFAAGQHEPHGLACSPRTVPSFRSVSCCRGPY
jgi:hypothetical protein